MLTLTNPNEFSDGEVIDVYGKPEGAVISYHYIGKIECSVIGYYSYKLGFESEWVRTTATTERAAIDRLVHAHLRRYAMPDNTIRQTSFIGESL